jgi:HEAT repeat protein
MKSLWFKACGAALAAVCLGGVSGMLRAQQSAARRGTTGTRAQGGEARARVEALRSPDALKRAAAAYELSRRPAEARAAVEALIGLLGDAALVDPNLYRKNERWWDDSKDFTVGKEAARALTAVGSEAVEPLVAALTRTAAEARRNAAWALGAISDRRAVEPLMKTLGSDADARVREQAAWAAGALGDKRAVESLLAALKDPNADVREQAVWALGAIGDGRAVEGLSAALSDTDPEVQEQAAWALGAVGDRGATDALGAALKTGAAGVRTQAAWALGAIGDRRGVSPLVAALSDAEARVREQAAWALGAIGDARAADALRAALRDNDKSVREQARWALGIVGVSELK